jgi:hypothetical protein
VVDDGSCSSVVEHVAELVGDVAEVDVHADGACLRRPEQRLEVLVAVVEVERNVVVRRLPCRAVGQRPVRPANLLTTFTRFPGDSPTSVSFHLSQIKAG